MDLTIYAQKARQTSVTVVSAESRETAIAQAHEQAESCFTQLRATWLKRCDTLIMDDGQQAWEAEIAVTFSLR